MAKKKEEIPRATARMKITIRYIFVSTCIVLFAGLIAYNMVQTSVVDADKWITKANKELERRDTILPLRGDILAADGSVLATNLTYYTMRIDFRASKFSEKLYLQSLDSLSDTLARYYPQRNRDQWFEFMSSELKKKKSDRSRSFTFLKDLSFAQSEAVKNFPYFRRWSNPNRTGLTCDAITRRCYPYGDMARRSVGRVGMTKTSSKVHGVSGLEYALDSLLYGKPGLAKKVPLTHNIVNWTDVPPVNGYTLTTTIDVAMQDIVEDELARALKDYQAEWGTLVLMEVSTGDIKAISNLERDDNGNYIESMNHAIQGFEPGSVMKTISMVIALEDGFTKNPDNEFFSIPGSYSFGGAPIRDTHSPSSLPVSRFLEYSSNIGMTKLVAPHFSKDPNAFRQRIAELGFLDRFKTGIAGEQIPYFPHLDIGNGGLTSLGRQVYGYASRIPPLYMCAFYNAVANDGQFVRPRLVSKITSEKGDSVIPVTYIRKQMCSPETARTVRRMLREVVYGKGGTARTLQDKQIELVGKTGTSRIAREMSPQDREKLKKDPNDPTVVRPKGYEEGAYRYAFCGFFPYDKPKYTCMVLVSRPGPHVKRNAGIISGQIVLDVARRLYSRGMLDMIPDYHDDPPANRALTPVLYASSDPQRNSRLMDMLDVTRAQPLRQPQTYATGKIPDVLRLGLRDAIVLIEKAGYNIAFNGDGTVIAQNPEPGTSAPPGTKVTLTLGN